VGEKPEKSHLLVVGIVFTPRREEVAGVSSSLKFYVFDKSLKLPRHTKEERGAGRGINQSISRDA